MFKLIFKKLFKNNFTQALKQELTYCTNYPVNKCIQRITETPWQYRCSAGGELWYRIDQIEGPRILIAFTGGQFRKFMQTQYWMDIFDQEGRTTVTMQFYKEMFGLPPCTSIEDIDRFMAQKIQAARIGEQGDG